MRRSRRFTNRIKLIIFLITTAERMRKTEEVAGKTSSAPINANHDLPGNESEGVVILWGYNWHGWIGVQAQCWFRCAMIRGR